MMAGSRLAALIMAGLLCLAGCRDEPPPAGLSWKGTCATDSVGVGDPLLLEIQGHWQRARGPLRLDWEAPGDTLILIGRDSTAVPAAGEAWQARAYRLTMIAPRAGRIRIPPAALVDAAGETLAVTTAFPLRVGGRVTGPEQAELRPLAPLVSLRGFPYRLVLLGVLLAAVLLAAWLLWRRRTAATSGPPPPPPVPPAKEFGISLEELLGRRLAEAGRMRPFTQELSWILRRYLGRRWNEPALEATRPEILSWLPRTHLSVRDQQEVAAWLEETDRIKFAGQRPLLSDSQVLVDRARTVVARGEELAAEERRRAAEAAREAALAGSANGAGDGRHAPAGEESP